MRSEPACPQPSRRAFIKASAAAGAGLVLGFHVPLARAADETAEAFMPNAFVRIAPDSSVTVICKHLEFGQGIYTGLATLLAEELDADFSQVKVESAPADPTRYNNLSWGQIQGTGNSSSIANSAGQMRQAGAIARNMLVQAAAQEWNVPASEIVVAKGVVSHAASQRRATFGALAQRASTLLVPWVVPVKDSSAFTLIGKQVPRIDTPAKTDGTAEYALDVKRPGMLTAVIARPPRFGARLKSLDDSVAKSMPDVGDIVSWPGGVAVLARGFWAAKAARDALKIEWEDAGAETRGSNDILADYRKLLDQPGVPVRDEGDAETAIAGAAKKFAADYEFPYLAHAPMEPLTCTVELSADRCKIWSGSQIQTLDQNVAAQIAGLSPAQVEIHTTLAGGSFGRRATQTVVAEAVSIAKAIGGRAPVRVVWTREDDIRGGSYRPLFVHRLRAGLDNKGQIVGWHHRVVGQPLMPLAPGGRGVDPGMVQGAVTLPYGVANLTVDAHATQAGVPVTWWRSVGSSHNAYSTETFMDELAAAAGKDPVEFRLSLLAQRPFAANVLSLAAEKAGWGKSAPAGLFRGVAVHEWVNTFVAQVVEISLDRGVLKVERVICAVDCGMAINPDIVKAQMEGGIGFGLGAALRNAITLTGGRVDQSNFHDYQPLRIDDMAHVEVHIVPSRRAPTGVGEAAVPPIAPAVANAIFAATGKRVRALPFDGQNLRRA
jgi:isoquinoline 1-oxidoreductase beta subunit